MSDYVNKAAMRADSGHAIAAETAENGAIKWYVVSPLGARYPMISRYAALAAYRRVSGQGKAI